MWAPEYEGLRGTPGYERVCTSFVSALCSRTGVIGSVGLVEKDDKGNQRSLLEPWGFWELYGLEPNGKVQLLVNKNLESGFPNAWFMYSRDSSPCVVEANHPGILNRFTNRIALVDFAQLPYPEYLPPSMR